MSMNRFITLINSHIRPLKIAAQKRSFLRNKETACRDYAMRIQGRYNEQWTTHEAYTMEQAQTIEIYDRYEAIDPQAWDTLVEQSDTATWFQTREAYRFYASLPQEMTPFVYAVAENGQLTGVVVGYITQTPNMAKQFLTRRAIIIGGALLCPTISDTALGTLLTALRTGLQHRAIYIETRNFHDYSRWRSIFAANGFTYCPHLNFHIDTSSPEVAKENIGKHRWKYIRLSIRDGATMVENPTIEQVRECYAVLSDLYRNKVKTPLFSLEFFEKLYEMSNAKFLLVEFENRIIGGTICVSLPNKALYEWFACGNDNYHKGIRPSSVATWFGMEYAATHNYPLFDLMGAGVPNKPYGVRDFKAEFGGELVEHGRYLCVCHPLLYRLGTLGVKILKKR